MSLSHAPPTYYYNPEYVSVSANPLFALTQETTNHDIIITYDICVVYLYVGTVRGHVVIIVEIDKHVDKEEAPGICSCGADLSGTEWLSYQKILGWLKVHEDTAIS